MSSITETNVVKLPIKQLHNNTGQIPNVPANPRFIRDEKYKRLLESMRESDLTGVLPLKVYKHEGQWVVLGGNMRLRAMRELGIQDVSCIAVSEDTDTATLRKIVLIDNSTFGDWDWDMLANDWDMEDLNNWGVDIPTEWGELPTEGEKGLQKEMQDSDQDEMMSVPDVIYPSDNAFEIPSLLLDRQPETGLLMPFQAWGVNTRQKKVVGTYHFYVDDYRFGAIWKDPAKIIASGCQSIIETNLSLFDTTPVAYGLCMIYKKRWLSRWLQEQGITVWADLNVSKKFYEHNRLGIPQGYNAFSTRGYADRIKDLQAEIDIARQISGKDTPRMIVYGGGKEVQRICEDNGLTYIEQFMAQTKETIHNE